MQSQPNFSVIDSWCAQGRIAKQLVINEREAHCLKISMQYTDRSQYWPPTDRIGLVKTNPIGLCSVHMKEPLCIVHHNDYHTAKLCKLHTLGKLWRYVQMMKTHLCTTSTFLACNICGHHRASKFGTSYTSNKRQITFVKSISVLQVTELC